MQRCPDCYTEVYMVQGHYGTGVFHPDGTEQEAYEEGWHCPRCNYTWNFTAEELKEPLLDR